MIKLLILSLCSLSLFGGSVRIVNDSPFALTAEILAADGSSQGKLSLMPQQQSQWQDDSGKNTTWSQTPYTVIFTCKAGKQFGVISGVQQGGTVSAMSAQGPLFCEPDKKDSKNTQPPSVPQQPPNPFDQSQGSSTPGSAGSADPSRSPGDPIWGPP